MDPTSVKALCFDVSGTVVDWAAFAGRWRAMYQPAMEEARSGKRGWTKLDDLHRESLATLSNGNVALMVNMARRAGLPWDPILGAEVTRPTEHGPGQTKDLTAEKDWDVVPRDFFDLADQLGC